MRRSKYILGSVCLLCATALVASESFTPIAYGVKSLGMGGVSIATPQGAESGFENPALLSYLKNNEISIGVTGTKHIRKSSDPDTTYDSEDTYTPYLASNYKINENFQIGFLTSKYKMETNLIGVQNVNIQKTRAIIPLSYKFNNFSVGASLVAEKEKYTLAYDTTNDYFSSTDYGYMLGLAYRFSQKGVIVAANYKSKIQHKFFNIDHYFDMDSAAELGFGVHWKILNTNSSVGIDYKKVYFSKVYSKSWLSDQNVYAIGYSYDTKIWSLRAGYRYVSSFYANDLLANTYPFESKSHYTVGGTYHFTSHFSTDIAVEYAPYDKTISDGTDLTANDTSFSLGLNYTF